MPEQKHCELTVISVCLRRSPLVAAKPRSYKALLDSELPKHALG